MPRYNVILNIASGTAQNLGEQALRQIITDSGLKFDELILCKGEEMEDNLKKLVKSPLPLLIGGGDGTIRYSAKLMLDKQKAFGIIPFGTMNMLARDLEVPIELKETFAAYCNGYQECNVDAAFANGEIYLCAASIGTMPSASKMREDNREVNNIIMFPQLFMHTLKEFQRLQKKRIYMNVDGKNYKFRSPAIVIANNKFTDTDGISFENFKRGSLNDGLLGVYATKTKNIWEHLRLLGRLLIGSWLEDDALKSWEGSKITIGTKKKQETLSIDGDLMDFKTPIVFTVKKDALKMLKPDIVSVDAKNNAV